MARARNISGKNNRAGGSNKERTEDPKGLKRLSLEADKTLDEKSDRIAGALGNNAEEGNVASAKLLVELAKRKKHKKRSTAHKESAESLALRLANEPAWPGAKPSAKTPVESCANNS